MIGFDWPIVINWSMWWHLTYPRPTIFNYYIRNKEVICTLFLDVVDTHISSINW